MRSAYVRKRTGVKDVVRVVAELPTDLVEQVDQFGIPAGFRSRTATLRELLSKGLQSVQSEAARAS